VIIRGGQLVAEWNHNMDREVRVGLASAWKSVLSSILGIAIAEGRISSVNARVADYYPEAMDVPEGEGPKEGRYVFEKDHAVTFRQLISNTSGYMKPGEKPGQVFHYQTFGMNITAHAIAKTYGWYDIRDPQGSPDLQPLYEEGIAKPIAADWRYGKRNFDHHAKARIEIFGYALGIDSTALDMARLGWLWRNWGRWKGEQLIPEAWLREATVTAPDIRANCPQEQWQYGYGFWTNDHGQLWPNLPRDSYAALGASSQQIIWVCPSLDLVVVEGPSIWTSDDDAEGLRRLVLESVAG
jgi:CubicO group peptidase (beta-lactamase class C family)